MTDLKPSNIDELNEVITSVMCHKKDPNLFVFSSSSGYFKVCDLRLSTENTSNSTMF